jgi:hypothetical protein
MGKHGNPSSLVRVIAIVRSQLFTPCRLTGIARPSTPLWPSCIRFEIALLFKMLASIVKDLITEQSVMPTTAQRRLRLRFFSYARHEVLRIMSGKDQAEGRYHGLYIMISGMRRSELISDEEATILHVRAAAAIEVASHATFPPPSGVDGD